MDIPVKDTINFHKVSDSLWISLQKHLTKIYEVESNFLKCLTFTDTNPFNPKLVEEGKLGDYWLYRNVLKDLFIDETEQLNSLIKAIRKKGYKEDDKKQLLIMILGYMDMASTTFNHLETYKPIALKDEELENTAARFERLRNFIRLNIKGIMPRH